MMNCAHQKNLPFGLPRERTDLKARGRFRRGGVYVFVLGSSMMVMLIGLAVVSITQAGGRAGSQANDVVEASALAESAVELALSTFTQNPTWQTTYPAGVATTPVSIGHGTVSFKWTNNGGIRIYGIGKVHNATRIYGVGAIAAQPLAALQSTVYSQSTVTLPTLGAISGGGTITSNASVGGLLPLFSTSTTVQAVSSTLGTITNLLFTPITDPVAGPDTTHVFDYYNTNGTDITSSVPIVSSNYKLTNALLGPWLNTLSGGAKNTNGIYVINCNNTAITISNCRVYGTLVINNPGSGSSINGAVYFAPAQTGYPSLMVKGNFTLNAGTTSLSETTAGVNFNPSGAPYNGVTDNIIGGTYPCRFEGIVYVSGNLTATATTIIGSLMAGGTLTVNTSLSETYNSSIYSNPAPGFSSSTLSTVSGSWQWETGP